MNRMLFLINKMNLLFISLEALDLYSQKYIDKHIEQFNDNKIKALNLKKLSLSYYQYNSYYYFLPLIIYINIIYKIINTKSIQTSTKSIISEYNKYIKSALLTQYLNKFTYIYYKLYNCYESHNNKKFDIIYIHELAIINLYIIIKSYKKRGIINFIEYLYKYKI
uniref:Hypothetical chloroplast RF65 n=1 Tax=Membranoptera platyphylla TaxID=1204437 RepID=A0A1I9KQG9_9FLOR|nr:hypothetical chloroplast RF65 [Membranoptera platyphylla]AMJ16874.1 hypothetical chloroplast RF65 [Membranoptera platyphylla]